MTSFRAETVFRFEAESIESAGGELRRLALAASGVGFELETARVEEQERPDSGGLASGTPYAPIDGE